MKKMQNMNKRADWDIKQQNWRQANIKWTTDRMSGHYGIIKKGKNCTKEAENKDGVLIRDRFMLIDGRIRL